MIPNLIHKKKKNSNQKNQKLRASKSKENKLAEVPFSKYPEVEGVPVHLFFTKSTQEQPILITRFLRTRVHIYFHHCYPILRTLPQKKGRNSPRRLHPHGDKRRRQRRRSGGGGGVGPESPDTHSDLIPSPSFSDQIRVSASRESAPK